jgi:hypothetical protein
VALPFAMRRTSIYVTIACVGALLNGPAHADCAQANLLSVQPASASPGGHVIVRGELLSEGRCYDDGGCHRDRQRRAEGVTLQLVAADGRVLALGDFEPGEPRWSATKRVLLPIDLAAGKALVQARKGSGRVLAETTLTIR